MADIDVVPKRKTQLWVWIVVALAVLLVLWLLMGGTSGEMQGVQLDPGSHVDLSTRVA